jgi:hypothetical protein
MDLSVTSKNSVSKNSVSEQRNVILYFVVQRKRGDFTMATIMVYKRNSKFIDLYELVEELSSLGLMDTLQKYYNKPLEKQARSIVAGPSFLQFLNRLFQIQITAGDIINLESGHLGKFYMLSTTGTWDEIIKLQ